MNLDTWTQRLLLGCARPHLLPSLGLLLLFGVAMRQPGWLDWTLGDAGERKIATRFTGWSCARRRICAQANERETLKSTPLRETLTGLGSHRATIAKEVLCGSRSRWVLEASRSICSQFPTPVSRQREGPRLPPLGSPVSRPR